MKRLATTFLCALAALTVCMPAVSVGSSTTDAAGLQAIAKANTATAQSLEMGTCASERQAVASGAQHCKGDPTCIVAVTAIAALTPCAVVAVARQAPTPAATIPVQQFVNAAPPPTMGERILSGIGWGLGKLFDVGMALGPSYMNMRLGTTQSNNSTALAMRQSDNGLAATQSTNNTFAAFGANLQGTATAGFTQLGTVGVAAATTPKTVTNVTGNNNAVNGSAITNTTEIDCPGGQGGNGQGGNGGNAPGGAGNGAPGGLTGCTGTTGQ